MDNSIRLIRKLFILEAFLLLYIITACMRLVRLFSAFCFLLFVSCNGDSNKNPAEAMTGNWLILYPDHHLKTRSERDVYGKYQDSIVNLFGLKLISLTE